LRSGCPINLTLEMLGDRWSLIVIRDIMFGNRRHYGDLLRLSDEGIASNILANRLYPLSPVRSPLAHRRPNTQTKGDLQPHGTVDSACPSAGPHGRMGLPVTPASKQLSIRAQLLEEGGERMWNAFMAELRSIHMGASTPRRSVFGELQAAFEFAMNRETKAPTSSKTR
jgi:hypothetical protein